jgi:UDP-N-acetylmuramoylalanine--D-glutamate ligase
VLNVSEDHLDRYAGMDDYAAAKARVFQGERRDGAQSRRRLPRKPGGTHARTQVREFWPESAAAAGDYGLVDGWIVRGEES